MPLSYADTTVGAIAFNIDLEQEIDQQAVANLIDLSERRRDGRIDGRTWSNAALWFLHTRRRPLLAHESCHILQAVSYPALFLRSLRELLLVRRVFARIRREESMRVPIGEVLRVGLPPDLNATLHAPVYLYRIEIDGYAARVLPGNVEHPSVYDITETDLLEADASIFQYKVEIGGPGKARSYLRWLREPGRSSMVFKLVARHLGNAESAYIAVPVLVRAAFSTTWPVNAFASLLAATREWDPSLPVELGIEGFARLVFPKTAERFAPKGPAPDPTEAAGKDTFMFLDDEAHRALAASNPVHPLSPLVIRYLAERKRSPGFPDWFVHPYKYFEREGDELSELIQVYRAPLIATRLVHPRLRINDTVLDFATREFPEETGRAGQEDYHTYIRLLLMAKEFVFLLATDNYDGDSHNCHHTDCRFHASRLCQRWAPVPKEFLDCEFPGWLADGTAHRLTYDDKSVILEPTGVADG
jgi:hypothetical protein